MPQQLTAKQRMTCYNKKNKGEKQVRLTAAAARWARKAHTGRGVTVALPNPLPLGVAAELLGAGLKLKRAENEGDWVAVLLDGPEEAKAQLLATVKPPKSRGSRTEGNLLPH